MTKQNKIELLTRLVKEGHITLCEAFELSQPDKVEIDLKKFLALNNSAVNPYTPGWLIIEPHKPNPYKHTPTTNIPPTYEKF